MRSTIALLLSIITITELRADDWPQWLGPDRNGTINAKIEPWQGQLVQFLAEDRHHHAQPLRNDQPVDGRHRQSHPDLPAEHFEVEGPRVHDDSPSSKRAGQASARQGELS